MRAARAALAAMVLCLLASTTVLAQGAQTAAPAAVPRVITFTGVFQPVDGQPPRAVETITVTLYAEPSGGDPLWQETQRVALDAQGRYALLLGATSADGIPAAVLAAGAQWLSTLVDRSGEVESPRMQLTSVPYALRAAEADTLGGRPASDYLLAAAPGDSGSAAASADAPPGVSADLVLPGTDNFLAKYVNGGADVDDSAVFETAGRVGIGTTVPLDSLHINFTNTTGAVTGLAVRNLGNTATSYSGMLFYDQNGALGQFQGFNNVTHEYRINNIATNASINFMTGSTSRFFVASSGNIGIGTTAPSRNLEVSNAVSGTGTTAIAAATFGNTSFGAGFIGRKARGTAAAPTAVQNGDQLALFAGGGYGATMFGPNTGVVRMVAAENWTDTAQGTHIQFATTALGTATNSTRMVLDPSGNLGIGTIAPSAAVEVVRDPAGGLGGPLELHLTRYSDTSSSGEPNIVLRTARGSRAAPSAVQSGDELGGFEATGYGATDFGNPAVGVAGFAAENWTDTAQGAALVLTATPFGSNEAEVNMVILPGGNVGIGDFTEFPTITDRLQVFGDIRVGTSGTNGCLKNFAGTGIAGTCASDRRFKKDITPFGPVLDQLTALQPVHYAWRTADFPEQHFGNGRAYGLIAQEVEQTLPELVVTNDDGFKAVDYSKLPLLTIQAIKDLKSENDALKQRVAEIDPLKQRVAELERLLTDLVAKQR